MLAMPVRDVVADANVVLKWFHAEGEEEVEAARALLDAHRDRTLAVLVLDLTPYEVGNALIRGRGGLGAEQVAIVLQAAREICAAIAPDGDDLARAAQLAVEHDLTLYDAAYAAVAQRRGAALATLDAKLLRCGLGARPSDVLPERG
jgi:predicted nucleic acid-binding protein